MDSAAYKKQYRALMHSLSRRKYPNAGKTARLLIDGFLIHGGNFRASLAVEVGACKEGCFKALRERLTSDGYIRYDGFTGKSWTQHYEAPLLSKYLNPIRSEEHKLVIQENLDMATNELKRENEKLREELHSLNSESKKAIQEADRKAEEALRQTERLWQAVRDIQENDPPVTEEKIQRYSERESSIIQ